MYITCKNCKTNFLIDPSVIGPLGRRVKCSKCSAIWLQEYKAIYSTQENPELTIPEQPIMRPGHSANNFLPVVIENNTIITAKKLYFTLCCVILYLGFLLHVHQLTQENLHSKNSLRLSIVQQDQQDGALMVRTKITNLTNKALFLPPITLCLQGHKGQNLQIDNFQPQVVLEPHTCIYVISKFENMPKEVRNFAITLGKNL